jgi:hypothetical protein
MHEPRQRPDQVENSIPAGLARALATVPRKAACRIAIQYWAWARQRNVGFRDCAGNDRRFLRGKCSAFSHVKHIPLANSVMIAPFK